MLLERGMAKEALAAFEATLRKEPNRLGATHRRGEGGRKARRRRQGAAALRQAVALAENADREPGRDRGGARVRGEDKLGAWRWGSAVTAMNKMLAFVAGAAARSGRDRRSVALSLGTDGAMRPATHLPPGLDRSAWPFPMDQWGTGQGASAARRPIAAPRSTSISAPSSAPAIARPVWRMTPNSIA